MIIGWPPHLTTFSSILPPKTPLMHTNTLSPGSTKFTKHISIPADPGPETGNVNSFFV